MPGAVLRRIETGYAGDIVAAPPEPAATLATIPLALTGITLAFGGIRALTDVSLAVGPGENPRV